MPNKPIIHAITKFTGAAIKIYNTPIHANTNEISPLRILDSTNKRIAIINIANINNNDSEYHDLPFHNFQTGNMIMAKAIMDMKEKTKSLNKPPGSATKNPVTDQKIVIIIAVTNATAS